MSVGANSKMSRVRRASSMTKKTLAYLIEQKRKIDNDPKMDEFEQLLSTSSKGVTEPQLNKLASILEESNIVNINAREEALIDQIHQADLNASAKVKLIKIALKNGAAISTSEIGQTVVKQMNIKQLLKPIEQIIWQAHVADSLFSQIHKFELNDQIIKKVNKEIIKENSSKTAFKERLKLNLKVFGEKNFDEEVDELAKDENSENENQEAASPQEEQHESIASIIQESRIEINDSKQSARIAEIKKLLAPIPVELDLVDEKLISKEDKVEEVQNEAESFESEGVSQITEESIEEKIAEKEEDRAISTEEDEINDEKEDTKLQESAVEIQDKLENIDETRQTNNIVPNSRASTSSLSMLIARQLECAETLKAIRALYSQGEQEISEAKVATESELILSSEKDIIEGKLPLEEKRELYQKSENLTILLKEDNMIEVSKEEQSESVLEQEEIDSILKENNESTNLDERVPAIIEELKIARANLQNITPSSVVLFGNEESNQAIIANYLNQEKLTADEIRPTYWCFQLEAENIREQLVNHYSVHSIIENSQQSKFVLLIPRYVLKHNLTSEMTKLTQQFLANFGQDIDKYSLKTILDSTLIVVDQAKDGEQWSAQHLQKLCSKTRQKKHFEQNMDNVQMMIQYFTEQCVVTSLDKLKGDADDQAKINLLKLALPKVNYADNDNINIAPSLSDEISPELREQIYQQIAGKFFNLVEETCPELIERVMQNFSLEQVKNSLQSMQNDMPEGWEASAEKSPKGELVNNHFDLISKIATDQDIPQETEYKLGEIVPLFAKIMAHFAKINTPEAELFRICITNLQQHEDLAKFCSNLLSEDSAVDGYNAEKTLPVNLVKLISDACDEYITNINIDATYSDQELVCLINEIEGYKNLQAEQLENVPDEEKAKLSENYEKALLLLGDKYQQNERYSDAYKSYYKILESVNKESAVATKKLANLTYNHGADDIESKIKCMYFSMQCYDMYKVYKLYQETSEHVEFFGENYKEYTGGIPAYMCKFDLQEKNLLLWQPYSSSSNLTEMQKDLGRMCRASKKEEVRKNIKLSCFNNELAEELEIKPDTMQGFLAGGVEFKGDKSPKKTDDGNDQNTNQPPEDLEWEQDATFISVEDEKDKELVMQPVGTGADLSAYEI